jgi:hypothetical protein
MPLYPAPQESGFYGYVDKFYSLIGVVGYFISKLQFFGKDYCY